MFYIKSEFPRINTSNNQRSLKTKETNNNQTSLAMTHPTNTKLSNQNYAAYISFGMINPLLKKSMRSPIFLQMKNIKTLLKPN